MKHKIYIIAAVDKNNGIGKNGKMPWKFEKETLFFKETTTKTANPAKQNMVIMGKNTWESLPVKFRPLPDRKNIVLAYDKNYKAEGAKVCHSLEDAFKEADNNIETIFIIGGAKVYAETINHSLLSGIYITRINKIYDCDTFFPEIPAESEFSKKSLGKNKEGDTEFEFLLYEK